MNFMRKYFMLFILMGLVVEGSGQDNNSILKLSIADAQSFALEHNRTLKSARIDVKSMDKQIWANIATGLPQFTFDANYQHQFVIPQLSFGPVLDINSLPDGVITMNDLSNAYQNSPPFPLGVKNNTIFNFTVSQLIFSGEYLVGLQAARVVKQVTEKTLVKTEDQTKETVATTYYLVLVLEENARVLRESLKSTDQTYSDLVKMNQEGFNEETDVDQMKIGRSNIQTLITSIESQKEISMKLLKYQLGVEFDLPVVLTDSLPGIIKEGNIQYLSSPEYNVRNSIEYKMLSDQEKISSLLLKRQQSKYLPSIAGFYRHQEQSNQPAFNFAVKDIVGVTLSLPIVTSGLRNANIGQAKFDLMKSRLNKDNIEQGLIMEFETAKSSYSTAFSNFTTNRESMTLSKKVYDKTVIKYKEGVSTSFELTTNQAQFLTAESNYYNSILSLLNAKARLDRILSSSR
jgi:outer membrane protein TolC